MKVSTNKTTKGLAEVTVELTVEEYKPFLEQAAKEISKSQKIPGFRPGNAPLDLVIKQVGEPAVWEAALEPAIQKTFMKAVTQEKILTVGSPKIDVSKLAPGNPVVYKATVSLLPEVKLGNLDELKAERKPATIDETQIDKSIQDLRKSRSQQVLADRPAKMGDKVEINYELFVDKVSVDGGAGKKVEVMLGDKMMVPGFEEALVGVKKDDKKEFTVTFPESYHAKNIAGKPGTFKVEVLAVHEVTLPEVDDKLAQGFGMKDLADLKSKLSENLKSEAERKELHRLEEDVIEQLLKISTFGEIPDLLINSEAKKMQGELEQQVASQGIKFEDYLTHIKKSSADLLLDFAGPALNRVKTSLAFRQIADDQDIKASEEEIDEELKRTAEMMKDNPEAKVQIESLAYRGYIRNIIATRKVMDWVVTKAAGPKSEAEKPSAIIRP